MESDPNDLSFLVETIDGPVRAVISPRVLAKLSGRSHVTGAELVEVYRSELEDIVKAKVARCGLQHIIRIDAGDLLA